MTEALDSDRYRILMKEWRKFLEGPLDSGPDPENVDRDVSDVAGESIESARTRALRHARGINDETPAKKLHRLRIDCKKLRYLLEFFSELFDPVLMKNFTRSLKRLQDYLGDFQDLQVQRECLERTAYELGKQEQVPVGTILVLGQMMRELELRQDKVRKQFHRKYSRFHEDAKKNRFDARPPSDGETGP